jgi:hypothetical protein
MHILAIHFWRDVLALGAVIFSQSAQNSTKSASLDAKWPQDFIIVVINENPINIEGVMAISNLPF